METGVGAHAQIPSSHVQVANISNPCTGRETGGYQGLGTSLAQQQDIGSVRNSVSKIKARAGETAQRQRTLAVLPEDPATKLQFKGIQHCLLASRDRLSSNSEMCTPSTHVVHRHKCRQDS